MDHRPFAVTSHTMMRDAVTGKARNLQRIINQLAHEAYTKKAMAPTTIERASIATYSGPSVCMVRTSVANAMEGAAANRPAKLFGWNTSPKTAKAETKVPPIKKRSNNSVHTEILLLKINLILILARFSGGEYN
jgi:hypothetical protein